MWLYDIPTRMYKRLTFIYITRDEFLEYVAFFVYVEGKKKFPFAPVVINLYAALAFPTCKITFKLYLDIEMFIFLRH